VDFVFHEGKSMADNSKRVKVKADVYWCQNNKVNDMSGKYQLNLCNLSDAACDALESMGITVQVGANKKSEMGRYIVCKSEAPIKVFDTEGDLIEGAIGNGSKAKALVGTFSWTHKNKPGISASLSKIVVTDLVEYGADAALDDDEDIL
jgi:hypothetical protein